MRPCAFAFNSDTETNAGSIDNKPPLLNRANAVLSRWFGPDWLWVAAVVLIAIVAAWPAVSQPGLLNTRGGGDSPFLLQRLHQLAAALADGHFPVRWMPDANYGYGYPFYNFYAPLSIYIAAAFRFLGFSFVRAIHLAQIAGFIVAGLGMFYLGRDWLGSRWAGLLAATAYTVAPFHMVNVYVRGDSLAEFWAMAFYPLVLLAADRLVDAPPGGGPQTTDQRPKHFSVIRRPSSVVRRLTVFAFAYAALILSHNISALIFTPFLLIFMAARMLTASNEHQPKDYRRQTTDHKPPRRQSAIRRLWPIVGGLLLAFALAAWFFVPALAEQGLAQLGPVTEGYFHYSNHFRGLDLAQGTLLFDYNPDGGIAFRLGLVQVGLAVAGAVAWLASRRVADRSKSRGAGEKGRKGAGETPSSFVFRISHLVTLSALIAVFMITPLSRPLWDHLPLLPFTQFPWRFLSVASFFMALLAGGLVLATERPAGRAAIAIIGSLVLLAAGLLGLRVDHLILTDADVTAERLAQYEWFTGNIGTTVSGEYLTPESSPRPWASAWLNAGERDRVVATAGDLTADLVARESTQQTWQVVAGNSGARAIFPTMNWPGWRATIDGQTAAPESLASSGLMALDISAGEHTVALELGRTPVRVAAELVSLAAVVAVMLLLVIGRGKRLLDHGQQTTEDTRRSGGEREKGRKGAGETEITPAPLPPGFLAPLLPCALSLACGLLLFAFLWRGDPDDLPRGDLTWDFAQMGYLHHTPGGVPFSDGSRLYEYGYSADEIAAGDTLTVTLSLAPGDAASAALSLVTPASARPRPDGAAEPPILATQAIALDGETVVFSLPIPPDAPAGLYVPRLILAGARPMTPTGVPRGDLFLRPLQVTTADKATPLDGLPAAVELESANILSRDPLTLDGLFGWNVFRPLGERYQVSWRAQNGDGVVLSQLDTQPGYGFNPTDGWLPSEGIVNDWLALRLPDALTGPPPYPLVMVLYDATTGQQLLVRRVGELVEAEGQPAYQPATPVYTLPMDAEPLDVSFGEDGREFIRLRGYETAQSVGALSITLYWGAIGDIPADFTRFIHLLNENGEVAAQFDGHPAANSYPTGQWIAGEVVADTLRFDLSALAPGEYRIATGFYRPAEGLPRLAATGVDGPLPDGQALLPELIAVSAP